MVIGYTTGVFDMFHIGHLNILKRAKEQCDYLIVGVTTDQLCLERKKKRPVINENDRIEIIRAIRYVDEAVFQEDMNKRRAVEEFHVNKVFVGSDWKGTSSWDRYEREFAELGCQVVYLDYTQGISSTQLREHMQG